jgi:S-DNA-T family DNA segregation ATPase FtsK/SpoIIIE
MAKRKKTISKPKRKTVKENRIAAFFKSKQTHLVIGVFIFTAAIFLLVAFYSFFDNWKADQSDLNSFFNKNIEVKNVLGKLGAGMSNIFVYDGFGLATFIFPILLFFTGLYIILDISLKPLRRSWINWTLIMIWLSLALAFFIPKRPIFAGTIGYEINDYLQIYTGRMGVLLLIIFTAIAFIISRYKITPQKIKSSLPKKKEKAIKTIDDLTDEGYISEPIHETELELEVPKETKKAPVVKEETSIPKLKVEETETPVEDPAQEIEIKVEKPLEEEKIVENLSNKLVEEFGEYDPKLELGTYKFPGLNLLRDYTNENITINKAELEDNKDRIVETLSHYKIGIESIKATIGPTVTLYEIVPNAGVRISKIKNLEDDIALSLSALGIRIIAPIPGKGTIGIEVPNKKPSVVSMKSVLASPKFQKNSMELPIALGKTISNETFVADLSKMPHLLMAGATGQGKSVGLNAVLASLLYKKHPAEIKFVLVDPKKVELTLYNKIERHYLAKLPDTEDAIITDTKQVINTLNSLTIEMDNRYDLLKAAFVRNIKEYNEKFKLRKLNPENGHQYLPYIVLVIDEFADLIMTAGKEIEAPIARLAQLARAVGIHLIIATQRPSVNVITGIIKANFPTRVAFRVTSKIDSRTILDSQGADQLIGKGDMLISTGSTLTRLQCAFIDTPEVEKVTDFIGSQRAYPSAHILP